MNNPGQVPHITEMTVVVKPAVAQRLGRKYLAKGVTTTSVQCPCGHSHLRNSTFGGNKEAMPVCTNNIELCPFRRGKAD